MHMCTHISLRQYASFRIVYPKLFDNSQKTEDILPEDKYQPTNMRLDLMMCNQ